jgi:hypothetical protein
LRKRVAAARRLDLDHVGAEVGQRLGGERAGDQLAQFEDFQAGQGRRAWWPEAGDVSAWRAVSAAPLAAPTI